MRRLQGGAARWSRILLPGLVALLLEGHIALENPIRVRTMLFVLSHLAATTFRGATNGHFLCSFLLSLDEKIIYHKDIFVNIMP